MNPAVLLAIYCGVTVVGSLSGGWIPLFMRLTHRRMQIAISFVSGVMLGIGLLHLLPHSFAELGSIDATVLWVMAGFLFMFFLERFFHFHHHDVSDDSLLLGASPPLHVHAAHEPHDHTHDHGPAHAKPGPSFSWGGAAIGLTLHGLVDGIAMAAAVQAEAGTAGARWAGLGAAMAIALHKPFDSLTIGTLMAAAHRSTRTRHILNALYSLVTPLGVLLFYLAVPGQERSPHGIGQVLGFAAGAFICIATSDLLPELQFHRHDRTSLSLALVAGIALAWSTVFLESAGHDHHYGPAESPQKETSGHDHDHGHEHGHEHPHDAH